MSHQQSFTTVLGDLGEVDKDDVRIEAHGAVQEANTAIGYGLAMGGYSVDVARTLTSLQNDLFDLTADLTTPLKGTAGPDGSAGSSNGATGGATDSSAGGTQGRPIRITEDHVFWVERATEHYGADLPEPAGISFPGGTLAAALLYNARMAIRRAERSVVHAVNEHPDQINPLTVRYLDSVGSLLLVMARSHNVEHGDLTWRPLASVTPPEETTA
jgi:cob(I)alamin adenosyltransferase